MASRTRRGAAAWLAALVIAAGISVGYAMSSASEPGLVSAQTAACLDDCDFSCLNAGDPWTTSGTGGGVWVIVHAKPIYKNGAGVDSDTHWYDPDPVQWPPMTITGVWQAVGGSATEEFTMDVDDDGSCDGSGAGGHIRCHGDIAGNSDHLCDSYPGVWEREVQGSTGVDANCVDQANMAFDFEQEIEIDSVTYCFIRAEVYAVMPDSTGLRGKVRGSCPGTNAAWDTTRNAASNPVDFTCAQYDETRPDNSNVRLDLTVPYYYR